MLYRFKVTVQLDKDSEITFYIETTAGNEQAARDQIESLVEESLEIVSIETTK